MPQRLEYYRQQASVALEEANRATSHTDRMTWLRIANEWKQLHDTLAGELGVGSSADTDTYIIDP